MEKIAGMRISRKRVGKKIVSVPQKLSFYNYKKNLICEIHIIQSTGEMRIFNNEGMITILNSKSAPLKKIVYQGTEIVTTIDYTGGELIFPPKEE